MPQYEERALVLDIIPYRETSSLVRVLTENEGKISLVARGLRSGKTNPGAAALQPFNVVRLRFSLKEGATLGNLATAEIEQAAQAPHASIEAYAVVSYWFEILKETSQERVTMAGAFRLTTQMLRNQHSAPGLTLDYFRALSELCREVGFGIEWMRCVVCDKSGSDPAADLAYFSIARGGMVCRGCDEQGTVHGLRLSAVERRVIGQIAAQAMDGINARMQLSPGELMAVLALMNRYLVNHLEHPLRSFKFVAEAVGSGS